MRRPVLVSIVIPTRNRKTLLTYALRSVLQQTYRNLQIIVHDNHSTDGTSDTVARFLGDGRVEYYRTERDLSMTENWNAAMQRVRGEYVVRLDDDNVFFPDIVSSAVTDMRHSRLSVVSFANLIVTPRGQLHTAFDHDGTSLIVLNKFQWMYLEYFALSDSNYTFYSTALLRKLFPDGCVYRTSLPDRFLNYRCIDAMDRLALRMGFDLSVKGVTRFDNQRPGTTRITMVDYATLDIDRAMAGDCHYNFSMHRILTIRKAFSIASDREVENFYFRNITSEHLCVTVMRMGHIIKASSTWAREELLVYVRFVARIILDLLKHPTARVEGSSAIMAGAALLKRMVVLLMRIFVQHGGGVTAADMRFGDLVVERVLGGYEFSGQEAPAYHGDIHHFFERAGVPLIRVE